MHTKRLTKEWLRGLVAACAILAVTPGCELLVDFDRTKIPNEAGFADSTVPETDATSTEAGVGSDAGDGALGEVDGDASSAAADGDVGDAASADGDSAAAADGDVAMDGAPVDATDDGG